MRTAAVFKQHDMPPTPVRADHFQKVLMRHLLPDLGDEHYYVPTADVEHSMQDALLAIPCDRNTSLLADAAVATVERRCLGDDRLIQHQDDTPLFGKKIGRAHV